MKTLNVANHRIAYHDNGNSAKPIVFIHGNSLSAESFKFQLEDRDLNRYRLIALDLPGHGSSEPSNQKDAVYSAQGYGKIIREFADQLGLKEAVFVGHSLGGHILLGIAEELTEAAGFVIFGTPPLGIPPEMTKYFLPNPDILLAYKRDLNDEEVNTLAHAYVRKGTDAPGAILTSIRGADPDVRPYIGANLVPERLNNEVEIVKQLNKPIAIFHGEDDQLVNGAYIAELEIPTLWKSAVQLIPDAGHSPQLEKPAVFNSLLTEFIDTL